MGSMFCKDSIEIKPSCDYCRSMPDDTNYVAKIYHKGKYNGVFICKYCLEKKIKLRQYKISN